MYIIEFFKRMFRKSNIPVIIYLVLNYFVISAVIYLFTDGNVGMALLIGLAVYILSLCIALSPIGEWILRIQLGCKKINRKDQIDYLYPLFNEVYEKAKKLDPKLATDIELYISNDECPNAFATGRKTICVTKGLLDEPADQIKATLGHEFGHLSHKDTDLILLVSVGNMIVNAIIIGIRVIIELIHIMFLLIAFIVGENSWFGLLVIEIYHLLTLLTVTALTWLWSKLGVLLVMKSSRSNEFEADEFSVMLGYGDELCALLDNICGESPKGLFANLASSHPDTDERIARIQNMGSSYRKSYEELPMEKPKAEIKKVEKNDSKPKAALAAVKKVEYVAKLKCISGEYAGAELPMGDGELVIGTDSKRAHIIMQNPYISGAHCKIIYDMDRGEFLVTDMSTNGTYLENGNRLPKNVCNMLSVGTTITLGKGHDKFQLVVGKAN